MRQMWAHEGEFSTFMNWFKKILGRVWINREGAQVPAQPTAKIPWVGKPVAQVSYRSLEGFERVAAQPAPTPAPKKKAAKKPDGRRRGVKKAKV